MAGANVGNLNVKLTLSAEQFAAALMAAGGDVNAFAMKVEAGKSNLKGMDAAAASTATNVKSLTTEIKNYNVASIALRNASDSSKLFVLQRRGTEELIAAAAAQKQAAIGSSAAVGQMGSRLQGIAPVITAFSYGVQDAASQLGTRGFGAALMAAANNIPMLGIPWGGVGVAVASGVSVAVQALGSYIDYTERAAKATKEAKDAAAGMFGSRLDTIQTKASGANQFERSLRDGAAGGTASLRSMQQERRDIITDVRSELDALAPEREASAATFARNNAIIVNRMLRTQGGTMDQAEKELPKQTELRNQAAQQLAEIAKREQALKDTGNKAGRELFRINEAIPQAIADEMKAQREQDEAAQQQWRRMDAEESSRRMKAESKAAPGVGSTEAGSASQFSQIQAALRQAQDGNKASQKMIEKNTGKTAEHTRDISRKFGRIKVATIA